jgi:hypothetical protein
MDWDPAFIDRSPMLEPFREHAAPLRAHRDWPTRDALQALLRSRGVVTANGTPLRLVDDPGSEPYESRIRLRGEMHVRDRDWHDFFGALVWLTYPKTKAALNDAHYARLRERLAAGATGARRGDVRDALTVFDENGAIVVSSEAGLLEDVRAFRWKRVFRERRERTRAAMRVCVFGHALLEKALRPYVGMTAHALLLEVGADHFERPLHHQLESIDALAAEAVRSMTTPQALSPLPLLGVPGWWRDNEDPAFYDNAWYFREGRRSRAK